MERSQEKYDESRRDFARLDLGIPAQLETLDGRKSVCLVDLSQAGAQIVSPEPLEIRECMLTWLRFETFGTVTWSEGERLGLKFDTPLPLRVIVETRKALPTALRQEERDAEKTARAWVEGSGSDW